MDFSQPMNLQRWILAGLLVLILLKLVFSNHDFVRQYKVQINLFFILVVIIILIVEFWSKKMWLPILFTSMGLIAIGKVFWDLRKKDD